jgi:hypothetical protein
VRCQPFSFFSHAIASFTLRECSTQTSKIGSDNGSRRRSRRRRGEDEGEGLNLSSSRVRCREATLTLPLSLRQGEATRSCLRDLNMTVPSMKSVYTARSPTCANTRRSSRSSSSTSCGALTVCMTSHRTASANCWRRRWISVFTAPTATLIRSATS